MFIKTLLFMLITSITLNASDSNATYNFDLTLVGTLSVQGNLIVNGNTVPGVPSTELFVTTGTLSGPFMYNSVKAAVDSITDASVNKPYTIRVGPGPFTEDTITMKSFVNIIGDSIFGSVIQANNASNNLIVGANNACIEHCYLKGATGSGAAAVYFHAPGNFFILDCRFGANNIIAQLDAPVAAANALTVARCFIDTNSNFTKAFVVNGSSTTSCIMTVANSSWAASAAQPSLDSFVSITGPNATFLGASIAAGAVPESSLVVGGNGFKITNTGKLVLSSVLLQGFGNAFYVPNTGGGPNIQAVGILGLNNTTDLNITHTSTGGAIDATLSYAKSSIATGAPISLFLTDPVTGDTVSTGGLLNTEELDVYGAVTAHSSLDVTGSTRLTGNATLMGNELLAGTFDTFGASAIHNTMTVTGTTQVKALHATNSSVFDNNLTVSKSTFVGDTLQFNSAGTTALNTIGSLSSLTKQCILFGSINTAGSGSIVSGSGFTFTRTAAGAGTINFNTSFTATPIVTFASHAAAGTDTVAIVTSASGSAIGMQRLVTTAGALGTITATDGIFDFIVIGTVT